MAMAVIDYKDFFSSVIKKEIQLIGKERVFKSLENVTELVVDKEKREVVDCKGDEKTVFKKLSSEFCRYSTLAKIPLRAVIIEFKRRYPDLTVDFSDM